MITSGYMMGFGAGDFDVGYLEKNMLMQVNESVGWLDKKAHNLYINVGLVARKP